MLTPAVPHVNPWVTFEHPQEVVLPRRSELSVMLRSVPQSQRQSHLMCPPLRSILRTHFCRVQRPKRWPTSVSSGCERAVASFTVNLLKRAGVCQHVFIALNDRLVLHPVKCPDVFVELQSSHLSGHGTE